MVSPAVASMVSKQKARSQPWPSMEQWDEDRHTNLAAVRKKAKKLHSRTQKYLIRKQEPKLTCFRKDASKEHKKRCKRVDISVSSRKLNLLDDSMELPVYL
jgi:hypothetical protein